MHPDLQTQEYEVQPDKSIGLLSDNKKLVYMSLRVLEEI
jgi:hypothetical protein